jgi:hypothetical protein
MGTAKSGTGVTAVYQVSAVELWKTVDFHQRSETIMPPIASSQRTGEGLGAIKVNTLQGGGDVHLLLTYYAPEDHAFNYTIHSSPLPVKNYVGEVRVRPLGENRSELSWRGVYDPDGVSQAEADEILGGFYEAIAAKIGEIHSRET